MARQFYRAFLDALCISPTPGRTTRTAWYAECVRVGLANCVGAEDSYKVRDAKQSKFRKYMSELREAGLIGVDGETVHDRRKPPPALGSQHHRSATHCGDGREPPPAPAAGDGERPN